MLTYIMCKFVYTYIERERVFDVHLYKYVCIHASMCRNLMPNIIHQVCSMFEVSDNTVLLNIHMGPKYFTDLGNVPPPRAGVG